MSKQEKLLKKITAVPIPANVKWSELVTFLKGCGYELLKNDGSRRKFFNKASDRLISCHEPHPHSEVDRGCLKDVVEHLRDNGLI